MDIKAIFFDIDGTLLSYNTHRVLPGTIEAFDILHRKGIRTFISSGRPMVLIPEMPVTFDGYITVNGGYCLAMDEQKTQSPVTGHNRHSVPRGFPARTSSKVVHSTPIDPDDCKAWLEYVERNNMTTMCFTAHDMYINLIDPVAVALRDQLGFEMPPVRPLEEMRDKEVFQFIALQPADKDSEVLSLLPHCRMPRWHNLFSDIIPSNSSKAVGIEKILAHFGINRNETIAFGDGANDIEMLDYVGISVAMGNAADIVKQHATFTTDDSDSEGILNALKKLGIVNIC